MQATRWQLASLMIGAALLCGLADESFAQGKKPFEKHDGSALYYSLREVINTGAKLYNDQGDHAGCYRMYHGALISVRPFLAPDLQKKIDDSIVGCERLPSFAERSFELRKVLDEIRDRVKPADAVGAKGDGQVAGTLNFQGKPVAGGYRVTLVSSSGARTSDAIQKDGTFQFKASIPTGEYRIAIEAIPDAKGPPIPARYASETTSGLAIRVQAGKQQVDLNLVK